MKITKEQLQQIIKEELELILKEGPFDAMLAVGSPYLYHLTRGARKKKKKPIEEPQAAQPVPKSVSDQIEASRAASQYKREREQMARHKRSVALPQQVFDILKPQGLKVELQNYELVAKVLDPDRPGKKFMMPIRLDPDLSPEENAQAAVDQINATDSSATRLKQGKKSASVNIADPFMESKKRIFKVRKK